MAEKQIFELQSLVADVQAYIKNYLWPESSCLTAAEHTLYFTFFHEEVSSLAYLRNRSIDYSEFIMRTYHELVIIVHFMRLHANLTCTQIARIIRAKYPGE